MSDARPKSAVDSIRVDVDAAPSEPLTRGIEPARLWPAGAPAELPRYVAVFGSGEPGELPTMLELVDGRYRPMGEPADVD